MVWRGAGEPFSLSFRERAGVRRNRMFFWKYRHANPWTTRPAHVGEVDGGLGFRLDERGLG